MTEYLDDKQASKAKKIRRILLLKIDRELKSDSNNRLNIMINSKGEIKIIDTYDFTDIKNIKEYTTSNNSKVTSVLSSTLNNFGIISQQYGVLKRYDIIIKFKMDNYVVDWK